MANSFQNEQEAPELVTIAELAENLIYRLPGCADITVRKTIQEVYREFCRETKCLMADRVFEVIDGQTDYPVGSMFGGIVGEIREVSLDGMVLKLGRDYRAIEGMSPIVVLDRRYVEIPDNVPPTEEYLYSIPKAVRVCATEYPKMNSELAPSWFVEKHGDAVCSGVMARLCSMQGRPWTDIQTASDERIRYENYKSEARMFKEVPAGGQFIDTSMVL